MSRTTKNVLIGISLLALLGAGGAVGRATAQCPKPCDEELVCTLAPGSLVPCTAVPCTTVPCEAVPCEAVPCTVAPAKKAPCKPKTITIETAVPARRQFDLGITVDTEGGYAADVAWNRWHRWRVTPRVGVAHRRLPAEVYAHRWRYNSNTHAEHTVVTGGVVIALGRYVP